ncbi:restriction endonuclease subunit S [Methylomonas sp. BW4-1]|uniref:restriction endonuclease subunit S n=1 Tax=Methylomonas sp. BW4-1 TaxID=3376685 RepID=UPI00404371C8
MSKQHGCSDNSQSAVNEASAGYSLQVGNATLIKPGYKMTEVGVVPEDWDCLESGVLATYFGGNAFKSEAAASNGIKWLKIANVGKQRVVWSDVSYLPSDYANDFSQYLLQEGDVVMALTRPILGNELKVTKLRKEDVPALLNQRVAKVIPSTTANLDFIYYVIQTRHFVDAMNEAMAGSDPPNIGSRTLSEIPIAVPPSLLEQRAIAAALSDVDALLDGLERLIAKKRDLKQAAMQQLLTGQTRLPGFSGEWEIKRLGDLAKFYKGKGLPKSALTPFGSEPCIHYGELFTQYGETIRETISRTDKNTGDFRSVANDVLMPTSDVTPRGLAKASCVVIDEVVLGGDILVIRTDPAQVCGTFLSHVIRREEDQVLRLVTGTTVFHLYGTDMKKFVLKLPLLAEQKAIVEVLADMDAELAALEARRDKTRALKQGMMQELLTGKTRLL